MPKRPVERHPPTIQTLASCPDQAPELCVDFAWLVAADVIPHRLSVSVTKPLMRTKLDPPGSKLTVSPVVVINPPWVRVSLQTTNYDADFAIYVEDPITITGVVRAGTATGVL